MTHADIRMNPQHFGVIRQTSRSGFISKSRFESRITFWPWQAWATSD